MNKTLLIVAIRIGVGCYFLCKAMKKGGAMKNYSKLTGWVAKNYVLKILNFPDTPLVLYDRSPISLVINPLLSLQKAK